MSETSIHKVALWVSLENLFGEELPDSCKGTEESIGTIDDLLWRCTAYAARYYLVHLEREFDSERLYKNADYIMSVFKILLGFATGAVHHHAAFYSLKTLECLEAPKGLTNEKTWVWLRDQAASRLTKLVKETELPSTWHEQTVVMRKNAMMCFFLERGRYKSCPVMVRPVLFEEDKAP